LCLRMRLGLRVSMRNILIDVDHLSHRSRFTSYSYFINSNFVFEGYKWFCALTIASETTFERATYVYSNGNAFEE